MKALINSAKKRLVGLAAISMMAAFFVGVGWVSIADAETTYNFHGTLKDQYGNSIAEQEVRLSNDGPSFSSTTDSNGSFSINVPAGMYDELRLVPGPDSIYSPYIRISESVAIDLTNGDVAQDLTISLVDVTVTAKNSDGSPVPNAKVFVGSGDGQTPSLIGGGSAIILDSLTSGFTDSQGQVTLKAVQGSSFSGGTSSINNICIDYPPGEVQDCLPNPTIVNGDTSFEFIKPDINTFSGTLRDDDGNPIEDFNVSIPGDEHTYRDKTDTNGFFEVYAPSGTYENIRIDGNSNFEPFTAVHETGTIDLTGGNIQQDLTLNLVQVEVTVQDIDGNPVSGLHVTLNNAGGTTTLTDANPANIITSTAGSVTDTQGQATIRMVSGVAFTAADYWGDDGAFCARDQNETFACLPEPTIIEQDASIVLQEAPEAPPSPSALTPTNQKPNLSWGSVTGAAGYRVFRDGNQVGETTGITFEDSGLGASGSYDYTVAAVNANGTPSPESEPFEVIYDIDSPTITPNFNPAANANGWNNSDVTVTFECSDEYTGVVSCSDPVTVSSDTIGQEVTGTATDGLGNSASVSTTVKLDKTAPTIAYTLDPAPNATGWHTTDVTITFDCQDGGSGIVSCTDPITVSTEGGGQVVTGTSVDAAGNSSTVDAVLNIDKTAPTITYSLDPLPNANGWNNSDVTATFDCQDNLAVEECSSPVTVSTEGDNNQVSGAVTDAAGNEASVTATVKLDKTNPTTGTPTMSGLLLGVLVGNSTDISAPVSDNLGGVVYAEYYFDNDPGQGNGTPMNLSANPTMGGTATASHTFDGLELLGQHTLYVRSLDAAGNWSIEASLSFTRLL